jgi:hypothetical protein
MARKSGGPCAQLMPSIAGPARSRTDASPRYWSVRGELTEPICFTERASIPSRS